MIKDGVSNYFAGREMESPRFDGMPLQYGTYGLFVCALHSENLLNESIVLYVGRQCVAGSTI